MKSRTQSSARGDDLSGAVDASALRQLLSLLRVLGASRHRRRVGLLAAGIVVVIGANMLGQIRLNVWQGAFYDALEQKNLDAFVTQLIVFLFIVAGLLTLVVTETWLRELLEVRLREWLTHDLINEWLVPKRAYFLAFAGDIGANPDQRMQADCQRLTEFSADLGIGLLRSALLLMSFVGVLWWLSDQVLFAVGHDRFTIPGYLVWCALAYALSGSWLTWRMGRPLIGLNAERYAREAELRFALVRVNEHAEGIALHGGEADERDSLDKPIEGVVEITRQLAYKLARLTWITSGYGWLALVVPILVAAPGYFQDSLSFGELMMVVGAFNHVQAALRWFVDNFSRIADWRATLLRVVNFRETLPAIENVGEDASHLQVVEGQSDICRLDGLEVTLMDGRVVLEETVAEIGAGDRLLVVGEPGSGKSTFFRALAGLWPWGSGTIHVPSRTTTMFMPQRPYLPLGTLRDVVTYPNASSEFDEVDVRAALERVALDHLVNSLDRDERWDKGLSLDEQQRLAFARLLLHAPQCVLLDDAMGALNEEHRRTMLSIFDQELAGATMINIGRETANDGFYDQVLHLLRIPNGTDLQFQLKNHLPQSG